tara:strand:- start:595 stop:1293 length:699 start_codon:yes stop_codon:yes gene_type:complete
MKAILTVLVLSGSLLLASCSDDTAGSGVDNSSEASFSTEASTTLSTEPSTTLGASSTSIEETLVTADNYCETALHWFDDWTNNYADPGPSHIEYLNLMAELSPPELLDEWAIYVEAFTTGETNGHDLDDVHELLINHLETECGIDRGSSPQPDQEYAGCWARAIYLIGWGVEQEVFNDPEEFQVTLQMASQNSGNTQGVSILVGLIEELYDALGVLPSSGAGPGYGECAFFD